MSRWRAKEAQLRAAPTPGPAVVAVADGRLYRPDVLVIGGTGRSCGKTELACRIVERQSASMPVVGLKVTTVERSDGHCPHGGDGCGVCSSLSVPWIVTREVDRTSPKDTCRLLAGGARRVFWLRVLRSELAGGAADLLARVPPRWLAVCESNSLLEVVEPGLFLLVRAAASSRAKPSARAVAHLAERVVVSDGRSFDFDLDRISVVDGQWAFRREACAVVIEAAAACREADCAAALRQTRSSLEPQFDRVVDGLGSVSELAASVSDLPDVWCLVTPPLAGGIPPGVVNAMYRRRVEVEAVVAVIRSEGRDVCLVLCRRQLLPEVVASLRRGPDSVVTLGDRCAVRQLRLSSTGSGVRLEQLPSGAPASRAQRGSGAEAL